MGFIVQGSLGSMMCSSWTIGGTLGSSSPVRTYRRCIVYTRKVMSICLDVTEGGECTLVDGGKID